MFLFLCLNCYANYLHLAKFMDEFAVNLCIINP